jgi:uncharacterized protein YeaC (DUF1315 family)
MQSIGKWPENYAEHRKMSTEGMQSIAKKRGCRALQNGQKTMQSIGKWPKSYVLHSQMARKAMQMAMGET